METLASCPQVDVAFFEGFIQVTLNKVNAASVIYNKSIILHSLSLSLVADYMVGLFHYCDEGIG